MSIKGWASVAALALIGAMASSAVAQPPEGGGRNRGGFGGGMRPTTPLQLIGNEAVQKDLGVTEEQVTKLKVISEEAMAEMRPAGGGGPGAGGPPSDEERKARAAKQAELVEKYKPKIAEILSPAQVERLGQISLQAAGPRVLADPAVAKKLNITSEQQEKLASVNKEYDAKMAELQPQRGGGGGGDREATMAKFTELNKSREKDVMAVLTADQASQLTAMKGKAFDTTQLRGGFGGGGRPGGGRPPQ